MLHFVEGNEVVLLENGAGLFPELEREIDAARIEIYLETYIFADDVSGRRIAAALVRAAPGAGCAAATIS